MALDERIREYYEALRQGEPLEDYFVVEPRPVKFGITETLYGYDEIAEALREQTRTTTDWVVTSHRLETDSRGDLGWCSDHVTMAWRDCEEGEEVAWETRWSGTLLRDDDTWQFVRMHVSVAAN